MFEAIIWDFGGVLTSSPFEAFARFETERGLPADIIRRTNAANHLENAWAKLALYRLATEAINNAVFHGEAAEIWVEIRRQPNCLAAKISNVGHPLPQDAEIRQSGRGIFSLLKELRKQFLAETGIHPNPDAEGTVVYANIPTLN